MKNRKNHLSRLLAIAVSAVMIVSMMVTASAAEVSETKTASAVSASYDITALSDGDYALIDGVKYYFVQAECVKVGNIIQYYRGVLKKETGEDCYGFV